MRLLCALVPKGMGCARVDGYGAPITKGSLAATEAAAQGTREDLDTFLLLGVKVLVAQEPARCHEEVEAQELAAGVLPRLSEDRALAVDGTFEYLASASHVVPPSPHVAAAALRLVRRGSAASRDASCHLQAAAARLRLSALASLYRL
jgi:hypothetical protein